MILMLQTAVDHTWTEVALSLGPLLITGLIGIIGPLLATLLQNKHKIRELNNDLNFKAREHVFEIRRQRWEDQRQISLKASNDLAEYLKRIHRYDDEQRLKKLPSISLMQKALSIMALQPGYGAAEPPLIDVCKREDQELIRAVLVIDVSKLRTVDDFQNFLLSLARAYSALDAAREFELEDACINAFGRYIENGSEISKSLTKGTVPVKDKG